MAGDDITIDTSEVGRLAAHLGRVANRMLNEVDKVVERAAANVKDEMVADASASRHFSGIAPTISYERHYRLGQVGYDVGPDRSRGGQAPLAGVAYFGGVNGGGGTLDVDKPLRTEEPNLLRALGDLGDLV